MTYPENFKGKKKSNKVRYKLQVEGGSTDWPLPNYSHLCSFSLDFLYHKDDKAKIDLTSNVVRVGHLSWSGHEIKAENPEQSYVTWIYKTGETLCPSRFLLAGM